MWPFMAYNAERYRSHRVAPMSDVVDVDGQQRRAAGLCHMTHLRSHASMACLRSLIDRCFPILSKSER
jgi:hypothetical protein